MLSEDFNIRRRGGGCRLSTSVSHPYQQEVGSSSVHAAIIADSQRRSVNNRALHSAKGGLSDVPRAAIPARQMLNFDWIIGPLVQ